MVLKVICICYLVMSARSPGYHRKNIISQLWQTLAWQNNLSCRPYFIIILASPNYKQTNIKIF